MNFYTYKDLSFSLINEGVRFYVTGTNV